MNCKPGDLAFIVNSLEGKSIGKIVRCINMVGLVDWDGVFKDYGWETDTELERYGPPSTLVPDSWMRPIRDNDGQDESLTWVKKTEKVC